MKIYAFGTCAGTEPMPGRHHTSLALEVNNRIYWLDAGECCSYTAHLMGVDLLKVSDIFISHPHMDHVGGLGNLLWNIRKLTRVTKRSTYYGDVNVYLPNMKTFEGIMTMLRQTEGGYACKYQTIGHKITDSVLLENDSIKVEALHNFHLQPTEEGWQSYSFRISAEGKRIIYSGDLKDIYDIDQYLSEGCDILFAETGHHAAEDVCQKIVDKGYNIGCLYFFHHGRPLMDNYDETLARCKNIFGNVVFCNNGEEFNI